MAGHYYRFLRGRSKRDRYEVKTLAYLQEHEKDQHSFAQLCRYQIESAEPGQKGLYFYRICLQDNRILDAVARANPFIRFTPLLLYIATHELIHVVRFEDGEMDFDARDEERVREEEKVHALTREILQPLICPELRLVYDCFSDKYKLESIYN